MLRFGAVRYRLRFGAVRYKLRFGAVRYRLRFSAVRYRLRFSVIRYEVVCFGSLRCGMVRCSSLPFFSVRLSSLCRLF